MLDANETIFGHNHWMLCNVDEFSIFSKYCLLVFPEHNNLDKFI